MTPIRPDRRGAVDGRSMCRCGHRKGLHDCCFQDKGCHHSMPGEDHRLFDCSCREFRRALKRGRRKKA